MKKRILASFLSLALVLSLVPMNALAADAQTGSEVSVCAALEGCTEVTHDPVCPLYVVPEDLTALQAPKAEMIIYVSEKGNADAAGTSEDQATTLAHATELANAQTEPVTIKVIGSVSVEEWQSPTVATTIVGLDGASELLFEYCSAGDYEANIDMQGDLTIGGINLNVNYTKQGLVSSMPKTGTYTIVANGHSLKIAADAKYIYDENRTNVAHIIGGALGEDLESDTNVEIYTALPVTYVVGGCYDGTLSGNTNIQLEDSTVQYVIGGGEADEKDSNVIGSTKVTAVRTDIKNFLCGGGWAGQYPSANANVTKNTEIYFENTKSGRVRVYGGGVCTNQNYTATVGGDVSITSVSNDMSNNNGTVYGGGYGSASNMDNAKVSGDISIAVKDGYSFGYVYGGGYRANVGGNVSIEVSGTNQNISPSIYGGGEGASSSQRSHVAGAVDITLKGVEATVCSLGKYGTVGKKVTINLQGGGGTLKDELSTENILNADASYINWAGNVTGTPEYYENTEVIVSDGTFVATTIYGAPLITIKNGGVLQEQREYATTGNKALFKDVKNVVIEPGGALSLLQSNEISGAFTGAGTLTMPKAAELVAGGLVTVQQDGAMYVPADGYQKDDVFLRSKTAFVQDSQPEFAVNEQGAQEGYLTQNRAVSKDGILHEWYVTQFFTLKPLELTKYMAGDHDHADNNCFPDPRFEGIDEKSEIKVGENVWDKDAHNGQYPFQIIYYPLPESYDLKDFPSGLTDADFKTPLAADHEAGTYIARVESNDGIKLTDITIDGSKVKTELSLLHIREVEKVDYVGDDIGKLASQVTETVPVQKVTEAVAVMPENMTYLVNNLKGQELNPNPDVRLLHDELLTAPGQDTYTDALIQRLEKEGVTQDSNRKYAMKYLDLIDANDSNLLVCAQDAYRIYIPYPDGTDQNTVFDLYHFSGLNRTYTAQDYGENVFTNIENSTVTKFQIENTPTGIVFTVNPPPENQRDNYSIGAMALTWVNSSGSGDGTTYYSLHYESNDGTEYKDERYKKNTVVELDKVPSRDGYQFTGWYADRDLTQRIESIKMTADKTVYAGWKKNEEYIPEDLNRKDHVAYVVGYVDGMVRPLNNISRAETAAMLHRLLTDERRAEIDTNVNPFVDIQGDEWYAKPVFDMANGGYIAGYTDGTFGGDKSITRAEFVAMLVRFIGAEEATCSFTDVPQNHWAHDVIATASAAGWVEGYPDGTFGPNRNISRAEAMSILNRVLDRGVNENSELLDFKKWPDNPKGAWYYYEVIEATNEHEYTGSRPSEDWTSLEID